MTASLVLLFKFIYDIVKRLTHDGYFRALGSVLLLLLLAGTLELWLVEGRTLLHAFTYAALTMAMNSPYGTGWGPETVGGTLFYIIYHFLGVGLFLLFVLEAGKTMVQSYEEFFKKMAERKAKKQAKKVQNRSIKVLLLVTAITLAISCNAMAAQEEAAPGWLERDTLTGDWGGARTWLKEHGITLKPRLTQFNQGLTSGDDAHNFEYGGKADLLLNADLSKLGLWNGFSLTIHAEYNYGHSVNGRGGTIALVNTALYFPGIQGADRSDLSSVYLGQTFGDSVSLLFGKINIIDLAGTRPFAGGAGIDSFWNIIFAAPPSGTVPPYLFGALLSWRTEPATFGLWVYDPDDMTNKSPLDKPFANGVTFRGTVEFPVTIAGRSGHQGLVALYSTKDGTEKDDPRDTLIPLWPGNRGPRDDRYYFAYTFDQYIYQSKENPGEGFGLFGQFGISDGNPNRLYWSGHVGVGGVGLIPCRSRDNWGAGYYYAAPSPDLKDLLAPIQRIRDEHGWEIFYNFAVTPWLSLGADVQIIKPSLASNTAVFSGLRTVIRF
jgi:porin